MLAALEAVRKNIKLQPKEVSITNYAFKLHYRVTMTAFMVCTVLVCSSQFVGEHIKCLINAEHYRVDAIETFCFFTSTFTVVKHMNQTAVRSGQLPHPGIGPHEAGKDEVIRHAYYQWVPFVLFFQGLSFFVPYFIWKQYEAGRLKALCLGFTVLDELNQEKKNTRIDLVRTAFVERLHIYRPWAPYLVFCELLNFLNLTMQLFFTQRFLGGQFFSLGFRIINQGPDDVDPLDVTFPKVTKCHFYKYGPSGTIQVHDIMCIMALNVINEKIYTFLWFWFWILGIMTILALVWRIASFLLYKRVPAFSRFVFRVACPTKLDTQLVNTVVERCNYRDWVFLYYLVSNLHGRIFKDLCEALVEPFEDEDSEEEKMLSTTQEF